MRNRRARRALLLVCIGLGACEPADDHAGSAAESGMLTGTVFYRERMALPASATVEVRLEDVSIADAQAEVLAEQIIEANGRQVPIAFELSYDPQEIEPNRRYAVRASIRGPDDELLFTTTEHYAVLAPGAPRADVELLLERVGDAPEVGRTFVFDCEGGVRFTVRTGPGELALWAPESLGGQYMVLGMAQSEQGARYEDGRNVFVHDGDRATAQIADQTFADCRANPGEVPWADAKRRGVTFRAVGNEPSWLLEIYPERLVLVTELGASRTELRSAGEPVAEGRKTTYRASRDGDEIVAVIERVTCTDTMSGDALAASATVMFDGMQWRGCGRFL